MHLFPFSLKPSLTGQTNKREAGYRYDYLPVDGDAFV